jgi:hypothetical protein
MGQYREFRKQKALQAFERRPILRLCDLPNGIGRKTLNELVQLGLIEVADPSIGHYSFGYAWRLKQK